MLKGFQVKMMRRFGSLLASSKVSKQPLLVLERSLSAYLVTTNHSHQPRFFSAQPNRIPFKNDYDQQSHDGVEPSTGIRVVSIQNVKPEKPTPDNLRSYKLSALDQIHSPSYVPFIFFYRNNINNGSKTDTVSERSKLLKQSLSETLTRFYPFAGKFIDDNHIDCNDEGVYYTETQVDVDLSSFLAKPDYKLLQQLLPMPPNSQKPTRGFYLVMIQVNFFSCGGVAISMCNFHKLIDGNTYITFLNAWASATKGGQLQQNMVYPNFVSSSLFPQNTQPPTYPSFPVSSMAVWPSLLKKGKHSTKRFLFDVSAIHELKAKATEESVSSTRVVAVASLIWKCATIAARKQHGAERPSVLQVAVNLRGKFAPPLPQNAIGNIIWNTVAKCAESNSNLSLGTMVGHIKDGIARIDTRFAEQFKGEQGSATVINELKRLGLQLSNFDADYYSFSSMCKSGVYEADFGWGRPVWSCYANLGNDIPIYLNAILLMDTSTGDGVEAWVTLSQEEMDIFEHDPELLLYASIEPSPLLHC
ncbi:hypothetical protein L6452_22571 [Arctium lappa]|uniref:Uncharacterized protein n=1 Tax=Arctium lappa TaxID=4217 RepID=A0ACB9B4I5_ARCLA|nr:hypothetical protein L6452_22571 [Arctium lappa]